MTADRHDCAAVDELAGAIALDALDRGERDAVRAHLDTCPNPHLELRSLLGADAMLAASLEPVRPSAGLRERLMASAAVTPQQHAPAPRTTPATSTAMPTIASRGRWLDRSTLPLARGLAAVAIVVAVVLGAWNVRLQSEVGQADRLASALADATAVYRATGDAGRGFLLDAPDGPRFVATDLAELPEGRIYELWLIGADGVPVDVGVTSDAAMIVVPVERDLDGFTTFALTVEAERVGAPTSAPVLVAAIPEAPPGT